MVRSKTKRGIVALFTSHEARGASKDVRGRDGFSLPVRTVAPSLQAATEGRQATDARSLPDGRVGKGNGKTRRHNKKRLRTTFASSSMTNPFFLAAVPFGSGSRRGSVFDAPFEAVRSVAGQNHAHTHGRAPPKHEHHGGLCCVVRREENRAPCSGTTASGNVGMTTARCMTNPNAAGTWYRFLVCLDPSAPGQAITLALSPSRVPQRRYNRGGTSFAAAERVRHTGPNTPKGYVLDLPPGAIRAERVGRHSF